MKITGKTVVASLLGLTLLTSCKDALDMSPLGEVNDQIYYQTPAHFESASLAPYSTLLNLYYNQSGGPWFTSQMMVDDDIRNPQGSDPQEEFNWLATGNGSSGDFSGIWTESYKGIMRANVIIEKLPLATGFTDESQKARFEAEARFIRAYFYFVLKTNFGNVPLVTRVISNLAEAQIGNSQPAEVWDQIESDLEYAKSNLPESWDDNNVGRATKWAATALLGKVQLFRAQWENETSKYQAAAANFNAIVSSGQFSLMNDYGDNFRQSSENNAESLFEIQMVRGDFNPWLPTDFGLEGNQNIGAAGSGRKVWSGAGCYLTNCAPGSNNYGYGSAHVTTSLRNEYEPNDPRRLYTIFEEGSWYTESEKFSASWSVTGSTPAKYLKPFTTSEFPPNLTENNERIIRYADVLLMLAEAELLGNNNTARATELINQVRARARNSFTLLKENEGQTPPADLLPDRPAGASRDQVFDWLKHERRVELALEAHRYDDLVRWHRAGLINIKTDVDFGNSVAQNGWTEKNLLRPIPQSELDNNTALTQNPGY